MKDTASVTTIEEAREELEKWRRKAKRKATAEQRALSFVRLYERQIERLSLPREPRGVGNVVRFEKQYAMGGIVYRYAAIRTGGKWWVTGPTSPQGVDWVDLIAFVREGNVLLKPTAVLLDDADASVRPPF